MKKNILIKIFIGLTLIITTACKSKKIITTLPNAIIKPDNKSVMESLKAADLTFSSFSTKAKTNIKIDSNTYDMNLNIRIKKNDTIWISATYFSIEVGRIVITPDSIKMINRAQSQYFIKPFSYLSKFINPKLDFSTLQSILIGNTMAFGYINKASITNDSSGYAVKGIDLSLAYQAKFNTINKVIETLLNDSKTGQQLKIIYSDFIPINNFNTPTQVQFNTMVNQKKITASLLYSVPEIDKKLEYPFSIPKRYTALD